MYAIFLNLNNTAAMGDSAVVELAKVMNACQPCMQEAETNCSDVKIVAIICITIVLVALIAKWAIWSWQKAVIAYKEKEHSDKEVKELQESKRKQEADLLERKLQILCELCYNNKEKEPQKTIKAYGCEEINKYLSAIETALNSYQQTNSQSNSR